MTLPRSRAEAAPVAAIALVDEGLQLVLGQGRREVVAQDGDLRLLLGGEILAAAGGRPRRSRGGS